MDFQIDQYSNLSLLLSAHLDGEWSMGTLVFDVGVGEEKD